MGKEADFMFTIIVGITFCGMGEHEPLIISLLLPIISCSNWRVRWNTCGSDWAYGKVRTFELECKREWENTVPIQMEGKMCQV